MPISPSHLNKTKHVQQPCFRLASSRFPAFLAFWLAALRIRSLWLPVLKINTNAHLYLKSASSKYLINFFRLLTSVLKQLPYTEFCLAKRKSLYIKAQTKKLKQHQTKISHNKISSNYLTIALSTHYYISETSNI